MTLARLVHLNPSLFRGNALFLAAFRIAKIAKDTNIIEGKSNAYFCKVLNISLATLKRYMNILEKIGFIKRTFNFKNNGEQICNTITINTGFFNGARGAQSEPQLYIFSKEKNIYTETETSSSSFSEKEEKSSFKEQLEFEKNLKNMPLKEEKIVLKVDKKVIDFVEIKGKKLLRANKKIVKSSDALVIFKKLFAMKDNILTAVKASALAKKGWIMQSGVIADVYFGVSNTGQILIATQNQTKICDASDFHEILAKQEKTQKGGQECILKV